MKAKELIYLLAAGLFLSCPAWAGDDCNDDDDDDEEFGAYAQRDPETPEQQKANLARSQAELGKLQNAVRNCTKMSWEAFYSEGMETRTYPISDENKETIRNILLTKAHAVCYAEPDEEEAPDVFLSLLIWVDVNGGVCVEWPIGRDSQTDEHGYQCGQMFSIPDADYETIDKIVPWAEIYPDADEASK